MLKCQSINPSVSIPCVAETKAETCRQKIVSADQKLSVLLVEHRGEVYSRLAADLEEVGHRVRRASCVEEAARLYARSCYDLLIINADLPDASGWLLASELQLIYQNICIWLYTPNLSSVELAQEELVSIDRLILYGGDLWSLSKQIMRPVPARFFGANQCRPTAL